MVAKINRGVSLYGAVIYNQRKVDEATARIIAGNRMITDLTGNPHNVMHGRRSPSSACTRVPVPRTARP